MALIACEECGHAISQSATTCPGCGARTRHSRQMLGGIVAVVLGLMVIYVISLSVTRDSSLAEASRHADIAGHQASGG
jgi:uncharacterized paraquat-inducible protein A